MESALPKNGTLDVSVRRRGKLLLNTQYTISQLISESILLKDASRKFIQAICEGLGWDLGAIWIFDQKDYVLRCADVWQRQGIEAPKFIKITESGTFSLGIGLPGRVWSSMKPEWIPDVVCDKNIPRAPIAQDEGLHGAFAFPLTSDGEVLGVMEFFCKEIQPSDRKLLDVMSSVGNQIGMFIKSKQAEENTTNCVKPQNKVLAQLLLPVIKEGVSPNGRNSSLEN